MGLQKDLAVRKLKRKRKVRKRVFGVSENLRFSVFKSGTNIYAQLINDDEGTTIISASTIDKELKSQLNQQMKKVDQAVLIGKAIASRAIEKGIKKVSFDRNGFLYSGRIKALADAAREGGLEF
ncbi:50S ribosomal protein L18 [Candidatus Kapabacteria bacterium]|nr:50S ribosomal protein L18 [Candidatus Kapabacteria bacterium]